MKRLSSPVCIRDLLVGMESNKLAGTTCVLNMKLMKAKAKAFEELSKLFKNLK